MTFERSIVDPPSTASTALPILRILFRASFTSVDGTPRVDADHFSSRAIIEDTEKLSIN